MLERLDTPVDVPVEQSPTGVVQATHTNHGMTYQPYNDPPLVSYFVRGFIRDGKFRSLPADDTLPIRDTEAFQDLSACLDKDGYLSQRAVIAQHKAIRERERIAKEQAEAKAKATAEGKSAALADQATPANL